jgi:hypothetical protein
MRAIVVLATASVALLLSNISGHTEGTWCAYYVLHTNCGFHSFEQCQAALSGNGGFCQRNAWSSASGNGFGREPRRRYR